MWGTRDESHTETVHERIPLTVCDRERLGQMGRGVHPVPLTGGTLLGFVTLRVRTRGWSYRQIHKRQGGPRVGRGRAEGK